MEKDCRVTRVIDGDTVEIGCRGERWPDGHAFSARIVGYDTPEKFSPDCPSEEDAAISAQAAFAKWLMEAGVMVGQEGLLEIAYLGTDRYGRTLVDMRVGGERVATWMTAEGHGRRYLGGLRGGWC